jgi:hypothetical protein
MQKSGRMLRPIGYEERKKTLHTKILYDPLFFIESLVEIVNKDRRTVPFIFNSSQLKYLANRSRRDIILKPRQLGFSSAIMALFLHDTMFVPNTISVIVAHTEKDATDLFERVKYMFYSIPEIFRPHVKFSNRKELFFDKINSRYTIGSAEAREFGRCVHPNVQVLVENGYAKKICEEGVPTLQWDSKVDGQLLSIHVNLNAKAPITVTPDHLILTQDGWKRAIDLRTHDFVLQPIRKIDNKTDKIEFSFRKHAHGAFKNEINEDELIKLTELKRGIKNELRKKFKTSYGTIKKYFLK